MTTPPQPIQTADSHVHALRQQTLYIHFAKKGQKPLIIMNDGRPTWRELNSAAQTVRTQRGKVQIWTVVTGDVLPLPQVHGIISSYFDQPELWGTVELSQFDIPLKR